MNIKMQPHVVAISTDLREGTTCYAVVQNRVFYECSTLIEAVDVCLKSTFVFHLLYPSASNSVWVFLQKAVYDISTEYDNVPIKVLSLLSDISTC